MIVIIIIFRNIKVRYFKYIISHAMHVKCIMKITIK